MAADENKDEATPAESAPAAPAAGGGNKMMLILTGVNLLFTLGIIGVLVVSFQKEKAQPKIEDIVANEPGGEGAEGEGGEAHGEAAPQSQFGTMITLDLFTVNLSTVGSVSPKFARVNISLEVPNKDIELEVNQKMPQVRNAIIDLFNSKRPADLATSEGRNYLKDEIKNALNSFLVTGKVKGVYFTSFALSG